LFLKIKKADENSKFGGKSWQTEKASISLNIIEGKIKQMKKKIAMWFRQEGKQLMSWTIFLHMQPKWYNHF
jgi:hypothetical protein